MTILNLTAVFILTVLATSGQEFSGVDTVPKVEIIDSRPAKQKKNGFESVNIMRCSYGSMRIGDKEFGRDRIALLAEAISENFQSLSGHTIVVKNYVVHHNIATDSKRMARQMTGVQVGGAIGGVITASDKVPEVAIIVGCSSDDLTGGYTSGEGGIVNGPIVTAIDLEVDKRTFHFRSVSDTYRPGEQGRSGKQTSEANFQRAQAEVIARFVPKFSAFLESKN